MWKRVIVKLNQLNNKWNWNKFTVIRIKNNTYLTKTMIKLKSISFIDTIDYIIKMDELLKFTNLIKNFWNMVSGDNFPNFKVLI